jgi:magnesium transporter
VKEEVIKTVEEIPEPPDGNAVLWVQVTELANIDLILQLGERFNLDPLVMLDIYLSSMSNRMNEVVKVLTIVATKFSPLTLIVGTYGMNLPNIPEYSLRYSYSILILVMLGISLGLIVYFR